jgi:hypothetical protein
MITQYGPEIAHQGFLDAAAQNIKVGATQPFAEGGRVRKNYALGGGVQGEMDNLNALVGKYETLPAEPSGGNMADLMAMLQANESPSPYAGEYAAARSNQTAQTQAFYDMVNKMATDKESGAPDKSEMYFRLAAAFGAPTKTGHFSESLGNVGGVMAEHAKETRTAKRAQAQQQQQLMLQAQQARMQEAGAEASSLRQLTGEEMRGKKAEKLELMKEYFKSGQPQSDAGKVAWDEGLRPGQPEYNKRVKEIIAEKLESGQYFKQAALSLQQASLGIQQGNQEIARARLASEQAGRAKLSPQELKIRTEAEDTLQGVDQALSGLEKAYELNPNTFDNSLPDRLQYMALSKSGSTDPKVVNTGLLQNVLSRNSLASLKATFPGAVSNDERRALEALSGSEAKSIKERDLIITEAARAARAVRKKLVERIKRINANEFRVTEPVTAGVE